MADLQSDISTEYGNRVRVRVGAIILDNPVDPRSLLLVKHRGLYHPEPFWTPPGGEVLFGEALDEAVVRETREETGLGIRVNRLLYLLDFVRPPLHAVSFYFEATVQFGDLRTGIDPELTKQLIQDAKYLEFRSLESTLIYPEGLVQALVTDLRGSFSRNPRYLGTKR